MTREQMNTALKLLATAVVVLASMCATGLAAKIIMAMGDAAILGLIWAMKSGGEE